MDYRQDPEAWADALLEGHRTGGRRGRGPERGAPARAQPGPPPVRSPLDYRKDPEAWADALLDGHRSAKRLDPEVEREATARALQELPRLERWMLTLGGRELDPHVVGRLARASRLRRGMLKWDVLLTSISLLALATFGLVVTSLF